jgi:hypothetical protein
MRHCDQVELPDIRTYLSWLSHTVTNRVPDSTEQSLDRQAFIREQNQTITKPPRFDLTRLDERATQREHSNLIYQNPRYWQSHSQLPSPGAAPNATSASLASAEQHAHDLRSRPPSPHNPQQIHPSPKSHPVRRVEIRERARQAEVERLAPWRFSRRPRLPRLPSHPKTGSDQRRASALLDAAAMRPAESTPGAAEKWCGRWSGGDSLFRTRRAWKRLEG